MSNTMEPEHLTEEQLVLHFYGEDGEALAAERHLGDCPECREVYASLERVLAALDSVPVPERGEDYGGEVWRRVAPLLPQRRRWAGFEIPRFDWRWSAAAVAMAGLLVAAFYAGREYPQAGPARQTTAGVASDPQLGERVLLVAMGEYLERSQMVLTELANEEAKGKVDISPEKDRAADLVSEGRLYRQTAEHTGDAAVAATLDEVDRVLLDVARGPSEITPAELETLRRRLKDEGILFKIRVMNSQVRTRQINDAAPGPAHGRRAL